MMMMCKYSNLCMSSMSDALGMVGGSSALTENIKPVA
jgi:hypothetical protein